MARPSSLSLTANTNITASNVMQLINDTANWKKTRKNSYSVWATLVQPGVEVYNELEGSTYTTTADNCVVLSGTRGEQWVTSLKDLASKYYFSNTVDESLPKRAIDPSNANSAMIDASQVITKKAISARAKKGLLPWTSVTVIPRGTGYTNYCFHLPLSVKNFPVRTKTGAQLIANREGVRHGAGDFIVCSMRPDVLPNIKDSWVVNGEVFIDTYNKVNVKGLPKIDSITTAQKPEIEIASLPKRVTTDANGNINSVSAGSASTRSGGAPRSEYDLVAKYTKNGKSIIAFEIKEKESGKTQIIDKAALYWLIGRGQIAGVTVQIRGNKIGLLAKDGFSLESVELKQVQ